MRKILPLTYGPKIPRVLSGEIEQTIRRGWTWKSSDMIAFHGWSGRPRRSPWSFRTPYLQVIDVLYIHVHPLGIALPSSVRIIPSKIALTGRELILPWSDLDDLARQDGIVPPTGEELGRVLTAYLNRGLTSEPFQVIRWDGSLLRSLQRGFIPPGSDLGLCPGKGSE
jgi:hypothetical protein